MIGLIGGVVLLASSMLKERSACKITSVCLDISPPAINTEFIELDLTSPHTVDRIRKCSAIIVWR